MSMRKVRLRHLAEVNPPTREFELLADDDLVTFLPLEAIWPDNLDTSRTRAKGEVSTGYTRFRAGDILLPKITPTFEADRTVIARDLIGDVGAGTTELHVIRAGHVSDPRYLKYTMSSREFLLEGEASMTGVAGQQRVPDSFVRDWRVLEPPLTQQRAIADYLDAETARIDRIIDTLLQRADLLELRKRAAVSTALRSVATATVAVRRVVDLVTSGPRGWSDLVVDSGSSLFLRIANVPRDSISLRLDDVAFIEPPSAAEADRCRVRPGDVLTTITAAIGQVAVVPAGLGEAYVSQHLALIRPEPSRVVPEWLALALWSDDAQCQLDAARYGGTKQQLALDDVRDVRIPWAPLPSQRTTVGRVLPSLAALTEASTQTRRVVNLLLERRQALITAAVTGQIEIPGVAA